MCYIDKELKRLVAAGAETRPVPATQRGYEIQKGSITACAGRVHNPDRDQAVYVTAWFLGDVCVAETDANSGVPYLTEAGKKVLGL